MGLGKGWKIVLRSTHVVEELPFSMLTSILMLDFDLNLGSFFTFWGLNGLFFGLEQGSKTVCGSTHVVEQLSFSMFPSILSFDFDLIFGSFFTFWGPSGLFLGSGWVRELFRGLVM